MTVTPLRRSSVRVLIVEDHTLFAESLELALSMEGYDVRRPPVTRNGATQSSLLATVVRLHPRIVLLDLDLGPLGDGVRLIGPLARTGTMLAIVTGSTDRARWGECLRYGARAVLTKAQPLNEILATVRRLNEGLPVMDRTEREALLQEWHETRHEKQASRQRLQRLTNREREVLARLCEGKTVHEIAHDSVVSEATVRTQVKSILAKLEVSSQLAAVGLAHSVGWYPPNS